MKRLVLAVTASLVALSGAAQAEPLRKDSNHRENAVQTAPGQVKKQEGRRHADQHGKRSARRYAPGQRMPQGYRTITNFHDYGLPDPGRGYRYVRYDDDVHKIAIQTATVAALIGALSGLR